MRIFSNKMMKMLSRIRIFTNLARVQLPAAFWRFFFAELTGKFCLLALGKSLPFISSSLESRGNNADIDTKERIQKILACLIALTFPKRSKSPNHLWEVQANS